MLTAGRVEADKAVAMDRRFPSLRSDVDPQFLRMLVVDCRTSLTCIFKRNRERRHSIGWNYFQRSGLEETPSVKDVETLPAYNWIVWWCCCPFRFCCKLNLPSDAQVIYLRTQGIASECDG
jgi:hypothetical protein